MYPAGVWAVRMLMYARWFILCRFNVRAQLILINLLDKVASTTRVMALQGALAREMAYSEWGGCVVYPSTQRGAYATAEAYYF